MSTFLTVLTKILSVIISFFITLSGSYTGGKWVKQADSLNSIVKLTDSHYLMDYTYNYDLDTLLESETGNSTTIGLIAYAVADVFLELNPEEKELVSKLGLYTDIDADKVSDILTELTSETENFGCTTFNAKTPDGDSLLARNYDYMDSSSLTVWTHPENGYASVSTVSLYFLGYEGDFKPDNFVTSLLTLLAPYIPVDGMNEKGLSIGVLELETDETFQQTDKKDITTTAMIRTVLDHAATVDEAVEIFNSYDMHDLLNGECTYHYQIADANGNTAIIEYKDGETTVIRPENDTNTLVATNFWLSEGVDDPDGMGQDRYDIVKKALNENNGIITADKAMDLLKDTHMENADLHGYIFSTLWSVVYNNSAKTFSLCSMYDYDNIYTFSLATPLEYTVK